MPVNNGNGKHLRCHGDDERSISRRLQLAQPPVRMTTANGVNFPLVASAEPTPAAAPVDDSDDDQVE